MSNAQEPLNQDEIDDDAAKLVESMKGVFNKESDNDDDDDSGEEDENLDLDLDDDSDLNFGEEEDEDPAGEGEEQELSPTESKASSQGWRPREEWEGDPAEWVSADVYLAKGELLGTISNQNKKIKKYEEGLKQLQAHHAKELKRAKEENKKVLLQKKADAFESEDYLAAAMIDEEIKEADKEEDDLVDLEDDKNVDDNAEVVAEHQQYFQDTFVKNNDWYGSNYEMTQECNKAGDWFYDNWNEEKFGAFTPQNVFNKVGEVMQKKFPKAFGKRSKAPAVGRSNGTGRSGNKGGSLFKQLSPLEKKVARTWLDIDAYPNLEAAAKDILADRT